MTVKIVSPDNLERFAQGADEKYAEASHTHSTATTTSAGFMSAEDKQNLDTLVQDGTLLSPATANKLGGVKVGVNLSITADGTLSADAQQYTLPTASASTLGGVKVGTNLSISNGVLSATNTDTKVTAVGNHYTPSTDTNSALTSSASSTGTYALNTEYNVVTGITLSRDAKGHVTGISTTNQKVKDTNTTYSAGTYMSLSGTTFNVSARNTTTTGALGWTSKTADNVLITANTLAYWNGATSGTASNLAYCNKGAFGSIVTKSTGDYLPISGGTLTGTLKAPSFQATSDRRKKLDIKEVGDLDLSSIKSYNYILKDTNRRHTGLIAQEVMHIIPDAVSSDDEGYLSLDYNAVVAVLVNKVNQLEARISELENK